jgi:hypothetical protein
MTSTQKQVVPTETPLTDAEYWRQFPNGEHGWEFARRMERDRAALLAALEQIMLSTADHPLFLGDDATENDFLREGGDAANVTEWHMIARAAIRLAKEGK